MRRRSRVLLACVIAIALLPLLLLAALYWMGNTVTGRGWIERSTAQLTGGNVRLQGLGGHFPQQLRLERLELRDPQGLWLSIEGIELQWSPLQLISWRAHGELLQAAQVTLARAPAYTHKPKSTAGPYRWPPVQLDRLEIRRLVLGAPLTGSEVVAEVQGSGRWVSLQEAALQLQVHRLDSVPSTYRASAQFDANHLQAQLDLEEQADGPLANLVQLPAIGALALHLQLAGPRAAVVTQLQLTAGTMNAAIAGTFNARNGDCSLDVKLDSAAMTPRPGLGWQRLHLDGQWRGPLSAPQTSAELQADGLNLPGLRLPVLNAQLAGQGGSLNLDARATGMVLPGRLGSLLAAAPLLAHARMRLDQKGHPLVFTLSHPLITAEGRWRGAGAEGRGELTANLGELRPLWTLAALDLTGRGTLAAHLEHGSQAWQLTVSSALAVTGGRSPIAALLTPKSTLSAQLSFDERGIELTRSQLESARVQASVRGSYQREVLNMNWKLTLPELAALSPRLAGQASADGSVQGQAPHLELSADLRGQLSLNGSKNGALQMRVRAKNLPQRPLGEIELTGSLDDAPLAFDVSVEGGADGAVDAKIERGSWKSLQATGEVRMPGGSNAPRGQVRVAMEHLEDLDALLGQSLQGSVEAHVAFDAGPPGGSAHVNVHAQHAGVPAQQLESLHLVGDIDQLTTRPTLALRLSTQALIGAVPASLRAQFQGPLDAIELKVDAASEGDVNTQSKLTGAATFDAGQRRLRLGTLELQYHGQTVKLLAPALLSLGEGVAVDRLRLGLGQSIWQAQGRLMPTLDLSASVHQLTPDLLRPWLPSLQADGRVDAEVELQGSLAAPTGSVRISGAGLHSRRGSARGLPAAEFSLQAQLQASVAQVKVELGAGERLKLTASGQAPLNGQAPMSLKIAGDADLLLANPILEASGQRLRGEAKLDAAIEGTPAAPQAHGTLQLTHADLQDFPRGLHLADISATLTADGDQLRLQQLTAHAGPGTIEVSGSVGLSGAMPVSLKLEAHNARPLSSDLITANVDSSLSLAGQIRQQLNASGTLHIIRADLNVPNALPPSVAVLDVRKPGQQVAPERPSRFHINMDLTVDAPRAVFVRGRGLDAEVGGSLHVGGTLEEPTISGGFDLRSGTINLAGSTLTFTSGRLSFNGSGVKKKIDPTLDFTASTTSGGATYNLNVGGYADAPLITLSSTPEQPQDQILSRLLFGADPAQLTTLQIAQIAAALATMSGIGSGLNPLNAVQRKLHLDRLAISGGASSGPVTGPTTAQGTNPGATIEAGRYVSSRVYVGAKQFTTGTTQAQVQIDLTKSLKIQTAVGTGGGTVQGETPQNDPGSSIGLSYQFEY